jgi:hypothetical protein
VTKIQFAVGNASQSILERQSSSTLRDICRMQYTLTVDAILMQLQSRHTVSLGLDGCTSMNNPAIMFVIAYYTDPNCTLGEEQLSFSEVDS